MSEDDILSDSGGEGTSVEVLKAVINPSKESLPLISCNSSPKHYALVFAKADWCDKILPGVGDVAGSGDLRRKFATFLLKFEVGRRGEDNRANKVIDASKALAQMEFEVKKAGSRGGLP